MHRYFNGVRDKEYRRISLPELYEIFRKNVRALEKVKVETRNALGYVLAEPIYARFDRPLADISHVDGFAVNASDLVYASKHTPVVLKLVKSIDPRRADSYKLRRGETVFVETGYPIPEGANAVVPVEDVEVKGDRILFIKPVVPGNHVFKRGTDFRENSLVFRRGTRITPLVVKALLDLGYDEVLVYRRPRVSILSIGDELIDEAYKPGFNKLPASTRFMDAYSLEYYGAEITCTRIVPDDPPTIASEVSNLLGGVDLVVTIGGVSMGPRDYTWIALYRELKPNVWWRGIKILPGRSNSGMIVDDKPVINQPGLHQSSFTTLVLILTPLVNYMQGRGLKPVYPFREVMLTEDLVSSRYIDHYRIHFLELGDGEATPIENPGSYHLRPMTASTAFTVVDPGIERIRKGSYIRAYFYPPVHVPRAHPIL